MAGRLLYGIITCLVLCTAGCSEVGRPGLPADLRREAFDLLALPFDAMPNTSDTAIPLPTNQLSDDNGVPLSEVDGEAYYHPVAISMQALLSADAYRVTQNPAYLDRAIANMQALLERAHRVDGAIYFPYDFTFNPGGRLMEEQMTPPWYSGMAQGLALVALSRLHRHTGNEAYRKAARGVFLTFQRPRGRCTPWVVFVDDNSYYWIEEYAGRQPHRVLNGFMFGVFGLYEYWRTTEDPEAPPLIIAALTTLKHFAPQFRRPRENSLYDLTFRFPAEDIYHRIHVDQLREMHRISGDTFFQELARTLDLDTAPQP